MPNCYRCWRPTMFLSLRAETRFAKAFQTRKRRRPTAPATSGQMSGYARFGRGFLAGLFALLRLRRASALLAAVSLVGAGVFIEQASAADPVTERVSVSSAGAQSTGASTQPAISADGHHIAFTSAASNLVPGDTNGRTDVFVRDLTTGVTERINVTSSGAQSEGVFSVGNSIDSVAINADGSVVAFLTNAPLVPGDTNATFDAFVRDRAA